jgi:hypothetical protein
MNLKALVERGFVTASLVRGGDAEKQDPRWLASRQQEYLRDKMGKFLAERDKVNGDANLSDTGRHARQGELATALLAELSSESGQRLLNTLREKQQKARTALEKAGQPAGESDIDRLARIMRAQNAQRFLLELDGRGLLHELMRAVSERDRVAYEAISELPVFILRAKGVTDEAVKAARREWEKATNPALSTACEEADTALRVAEQDYGDAVKAIRDFAGLPAERQVTVVS